MRPSSSSLVRVLLSSPSLLFNELRCCELADCRSVVINTYQNRKKAFLLQQLLRKLKEESLKHIYFFTEYGRARLYTMHDFKSPVQASQPNAKREERGVVLA